eukprot:6190059-Pleurochrysis_carterae.AAC.1
MPSSSSYVNPFYLSLVSDNGALDSTGLVDSNTAPADASACVASVISRERRNDALVYTSDYSTRACANLILHAIHLERLRCIMLPCTYLRTCSFVMPAQSTRVRLICGEAKRAQMDRSEMCSTMCQAPLFAIHLLRRMALFTAMLSMCRSLKLDNILSPLTMTIRVASPCTVFTPQPLCDAHGAGVPANAMLTGRVGYLLATEY